MRAERVAKMFSKCLLYMRIKKTSLTLNSGKHCSVFSDENCDLKEEVCEPVCEPFLSMLSDEGKRSQ